MNKSCAHCKSQFEPRRNTGGRPQRFCSDDCRRDFWSGPKAKKTGLWGSIVSLLWRRGEGEKWQDHPSNERVAYRVSQRSQDHPIFVGIKEYALTKSHMSFSANDARRIAKKAGYKASSSSSALSAFVKEGWVERVAPARYRLVVAPSIVHGNKSQKTYYIKEGHATRIGRFIREHPEGVSKDQVYEFSRRDGIDKSDAERALSALLRWQKVIRFKPDGGIERYFDWNLVERRTAP